MLIAGAGGFSKQLLEIFAQLDRLDDIIFFDDYTRPPVELLYGRFPIYHSLLQLQNLFETDNRFVLGIGGPKNRHSLDKKLTGLGGCLTSVISPKATVSAISTSIKDGVAILTGAIVENGVEIGHGSLINIGAFVTHDCIIGDYTEISPGTRLSGGCRIGSKCFIGTGSVLIPKISVGDGAVIAAGSVVTKDVPPNVMVAGVPATVKKSLNVS